MNYNKINSYFLFVIITLFMASCADSDKVFDQVVEGEQRGAVLRQTNVIANSVAVNSDTGQLEAGEQFAVDLEYQDTQDGALLSEMDVFLSFTDKTDDGVDNSKSEIAYESIPASSFTTGDRGLPTFAYAVSGEDMLTALGMDVSQLGIGGDQFNVRFEVVLTDGRKFSAAQNSGNITGSYFSSPFSNLVTVVCAPTMPTSGTWTFRTNDNYGDGWNGASLVVILDGNEADAISIVNDGSTGTDDQIFDVDVPAGTGTISIKYVSGAWDSEVSFTITSANGNDVIVATPSPSAGVELLDYCAGGL